MAPFPRTILGLTLAGGLSACAGGTVGTAYLGSYDPATVNYVAARGPLHTEVLGNPFAASRAELERAVTEAMSGANPGQPMQFSTEKDLRNRSPYRLVVVFNPGREIGPQKLCEGTAAPSAEADGTIRILAAFCADGSRETSVAGRLGQVTGPNDPALRTLLRHMTAELFPRKNDNLLGRDDYEI